MINIFKNRKHRTNRSFDMPKFTTTIFLAFISLGSFAQKSALTLEKLGLKSLQQKMSYIPAKSFNSLVHTGSDSVSNYTSRISTVRGFYISQTEVTNKEYREFVHYIRDSIAHNLLQHWQSGTNAIDWNQKIDWKDERLDPIMIDPEYSITGRKEIDANKIFFEIDFFGQKETISIYPDTLVWIRDFSYSYNEPLAKRYFTYKEYDQYPVVGISLKQAMAFCQWKTTQLKKQIKGDAAVVVSLPSHAEWESAAIDDKGNSGEVQKGGTYLCNFGAVTAGKGYTGKDYKDDGFFYTGPVKSYPPNSYGLYDMKGNVAEWTSTARDEIVNVEVKADKQKNYFIVKGGGWNSTAFYLQPGACQFFPTDAAHCFVGFRYVVRVEAKQ